MLITTEITTHFYSFLAFFFSACVLCIFTLFVSYFLGGRSYGRSKNIPFESGMNPTKNARLKFSVKFYLVAMFFVIFDVEALYLYVWSLVILETNWIGFFEATIFIFLQLVGLLYLVRLGALNWTPKKENMVDKYKNDLKKFLLIQKERLE